MAQIRCEKPLNSIVRTELERIEALPPLPPVPTTKETTVEGFPLTGEQKEAVELALSSHLSVIAGMAGTGKSALVPVLAAGAKEETLLCAATDKAARCLAARTGLTAKGVEAALRPIPGADMASSHRWPHTDLMILDSAEDMTEEMLAGLLTRAKEDCRVVLLGDVRPGSFLERLVKRGVPCSRLTRSFRHKDPDSALCRNVSNFFQAEGLVWDDSFRFVEGGETALQSLVADAAKLDERDVDHQVLMLPFPGVEERRALLN